MRFHVTYFPNCFVSLYLSWGKVILCVHRGLSIFTLIFKNRLGTIFFFFKENTSLSSTEGSLFMIITFFPPKDGKKIPKLVWPRAASERPVHGQKRSPWFSSLFCGWSGGEGMSVLGQQNSETGMRIQPVEGARATSQLYRVEQGHNNFFFLNEVNS